MALHRAQLCRRGSRNGSEKEEEEEEGDGYIQVFVRPLEQGRCGLVLGWLGLSGASLTAQQVGALYGLGALATSACVYQLLRCDVGLLFYRLCGLAVPMFSIVCAFYWLSLCFRKTWSNTSVYLLFSSCYVGETLAQILACGDDRGGGPPSSSSVTQPLVVFAVLLSVSLASLFSSLETAYSAVVILVVSSARLLACTALADLPQGLRPYIAYSCGFGGIIVSKYMETVFRPPVNNYMTQDGKIPVIKRRRSSSSSSHGFSTHRSTRRTSLPALIQRSQSSAASYESAVIGEAHGLITDMLAESSLPPHIVSGLRAVSNLLKPPESHPAIHKTKVSPLVSLTESTSYGSDSEDLPYTGERPSSLPKRLRRSLPPNLIRRMSTSTWTTTTSATGMPTLEPEPSRIRSSSFRHSRDGTPASSPVGSRSNSPSPSSPTTVVLSIPKSRSFSLANTSTGLPVHSRRLTRKGILLPSSDHTSTSPTKLDTKPMSPLTKGELHQEEIDGSKYTGGRDTQTGPLRRLNITSDYESSDSPSSSDHSDNVMTSDDLSGSPPKKLGGRMEGDNQFRETANFHSSSKERGDDEDDRLVPNDSSSQDKARPEKKSGGDVQEEWELPYTSADLDNCALLRIEWLNDWDYPIFKMAENKGKFILSQVACKLFMEVGLFETFRIPEVQFIHYFHSLEMGYREKPYHNRVHATDVLHGVYYLTTQRIPGFQQINCTDLFNRLCSSSESESDSAEKLGHTHRATFSTDDSYGIMGANFPALELMALYTAAAMHDYDHPGRTNAFLVATHAPQAVLYNDRSVLENHHAASAWQLLLSHHNHNFLCGLDKAEFKRFRFLVIEAILATDLKRHFEILAEFNAKVNEDDAPGIDWTVESDRLLVMQMLIKLADINGPAKRQELHTQWTHRISEEFYEQGDEEARRGMPISPYMDRRNPQLAKLQESFINHLVAPLCNAMVSGGLLPGTWVDPNGEELSDSEKGENSAFKDTEDETDQDMGGSFPIKQTKKTRKINCLLTKNLKENHEMWVAKIKEEQQKQAAAEIEQEKNQILQGAEGNGEKPEMESIKEELEGSPVSTNNAQSRCCCRHSPLESHRSSET